MTITCPVCAWQREAPASADDVDVCMNCGTIAPPASAPAQAAAPPKSRPPWEESGALAVETLVLQDVARCVKCSARRLPEDLQCRFCREDFGVRETLPATAPPEPTAVGKRRRLLVLIGGALIVAGAVLLFPSRRNVEAPVIAPELACENNILLLQDAYRKAHLNHLRMPTSSGFQFWRELASLKPGSPAFGCPLSKQGYRGPAKSWAELEDHDVILADLAGDHAGGGRVLYKNGEVRRVARGSPLYESVLSATKE